VTLAEEVRRIWWAFDSADTRAKEVLDLAVAVARLERARDDLLAALKVFADEATTVTANHRENAQRLIRSIEGV
jgi:hypothetical protein